MKLYRLESRTTNQGYFTTPCSISLSNSVKFIEGWKYPDMFSDTNTDTTDRPVYRKYKCACQSKALLLHWFDVDMITELLSKHNFRLLEIEISENYVRTGEKQVIYNPDKVDSIIEIGVNEL